MQRYVLYCSVQVPFTLRPCGYHIPSVLTISV